jgi:hypothetical protein
VQHQLDHRVVLAVLDQTLRGLGAASGRAVLVGVAPERLYDAGQDGALARAVGSHDEVDVGPKVDGKVSMSFEVGKRQRAQHPILEVGRARALDALARDRAVGRVGIGTRPAHRPAAAARTGRNAETGGQAEGVAVRCDRRVRLAPMPQGGGG